MADSKNELDLAFEELEKEYGQNREIRREMINALRRQIPKAEISEFDKAMMVTAKLEILKTLDSIIKSDEDVSFKKLKMKLARKDSETNGMVGSQITALLKTIRVNDPRLANTPATSDPTAKALDQVLEKTEDLLKNGDEKTKKMLSVSEGELLECGTSPTTDNSAAPIKPLKGLDDDDEEEG